MDILSDMLGPGLKVVFCGMAAGNRSARIGAYYAGRGNRFWEVLHRIGLTPYRLRPEEYPNLLHYGIGLTDLVKSAFGNDRALKKVSFDVAGLRGRPTAAPYSTTLPGAPRAASPGATRGGGRPVPVGSGIPLVSLKSDADYDDHHFRRFFLPRRCILRPSCI